MFAKVTKEFSGRPDDAPLPRRVLVGEVISGDLAAVAVREKWAEEVPPNEKSEQRPDDLRATLTRYPVDMLKVMAKEKAIDLGEATKKADIVDVLVKALDTPTETA